MTSRCHLMLGPMPKWKENTETRLRDFSSLLRCLAPTPADAADPSLQQKKNHRQHHDLAQRLTLRPAGPDGMHAPASPFFGDINTASPSAPTITPPNIDSILTSGPKNIFSWQVLSRRAVTRRFSQLDSLSSRSRLQLHNF